MGFWSSLDSFIFGPLPETKGGTPVPVHSPDAVEAALRADLGDEGLLSDRVSAVHACARVIAEGLAQPPCFLHRDTGTGMVRATDHALHSLLAESPNERQTSYEFREQLGWHLALYSEAFVFINRGPTGVGAIRELLPCDPGQATVEADESRLGGPVTYRIYGVQVPSNQVWHLKGPAMRSWKGMSTLTAARRAIGLAESTETFGAATFKNGAKPGGLITPVGEAQWTETQLAQIKAAWNASRGAANAHKTVAMNAPISFTPMANNASDSQWIEARRFQIEEICRYFRVSPTKVFHTMGSQSYASVEQAHIAHDQDTDAHWHERFVQSANKALLTPAERKQGYRVMIDNRAALRGTAKERMEYYQLGLLNGILTPNEVRELEGFDRSSDPAADQLRPAANLYGDQPKDEPDADEGDEPVA
ncbi:phage portal protein [Sphingomonas melonis]|jgi:HK97 family phage portal protein|nr:phage portal protein [Sphingomonas melonis]